MTTSRLSPFFLATTLSLAAATVSAQQAVAVRAPDVTMGLKRDPALAAAIAEISTAQIRSTDSALVSFGTRHTMSDTLSNSRGIGAARRYLFNKLTDYSKACGGCLKVEYDPAMMEMRGHPQRPMVNIVNVISNFAAHPTLKDFYPPINLYSTMDFWSTMWFDK